VITPVETRQVPLDELTPFPGNAKKGDIPKIRESLRRLGQYRSLTVRQCDDGTLVILAGNNTYAAMGEEGWAEARCEIIACDDDTARRINVGDNKLGELGTTDQSALAQIMAMFEGDFEATGFVAPEVDELFRATDFLGNQATAFLNDFTAPATPPAGLPVGATHQPAQPAPDPDGTGVPAGTTAASPGPAQPAAPSVSLPDGPPTPAGPSYVPMSWMVLPDERDIIRQAITACQAATGAETSAVALVEVARHYLAAQDALVGDDERTSP
jgi:hypothetical protein